MSEYIPAGSLKDGEESGSSLIEITGNYIIPSELKEGEPIDRFDEIIQLEKESAAIEYIRNSYAQKDLDAKSRALAPIIAPMHAVQEIGNQFAKKILPAFMCNSPQEGLAKFRGITAQTIQEEMVLLTNDEQFLNMHTGLGIYLETNKNNFAIIASERLNPKNGQITINDRLQFRGIETLASLENILHEGVKIRLEPAAARLVKEKAKIAQSGPIPVTEYIKNHRILNINGFKESKISLAAHDVMDHAWTFNLLNTKGYLNEYSEMLDSIGNPHLTNIFFREGEAIASIAYGVRYWSMMEPGFMPVITTLDIAKLMDEMFDKGELSEERHLRAYKVIRKLSNEQHSREAQCLGFSFSNYCTELDEQRRKHGKIKQRDPVSGRVIGELNVLSADFLSFFIEAHHEILQSSNKHRNDLFVFHITLEEFLKGVGEGSVLDDETLVIKVQDLRTKDVSSTTLSAERLHWMFRNYGFTGVKDSIY